MGVNLGRIGENKNGSNHPFSCSVREREGARVVAVRGPALKSAAGPAKICVLAHVPLQTKGTKLMLMYNAKFKWEGTQRVGGTKLSSCVN